MSNCKTIAICNQKGGVGKTTTSVNLGIGLAMQGNTYTAVSAEVKGVIPINKNGILSLELKTEYIGH